MKQLLLSVLFLALSFAVQAQLKISGRLIEKGTKIPLKEITVYILPHKLKAETNDKGEFEFLDVPPGDFQFVVSQANYEKLEQKDSTDIIGTRLLFLEKSTYLTFETRIVGQKQKRDDAKKTLTQAEFLTLPGSGGDPVKAVQNLPGVNRVAGFSSAVVIQGSAPQDTRYDIDGHQVPIVFHFGGLTSVVMPEAIESVDYLSAGFGADYSSALGGIISLKTRSPDIKERNKKGFFFVDTLKSGALVEGKIDDHSSYLLSGRFSYVGFLLKAAMKDNADFNLTVAPEFSDLTFIYKNKLNEQDDFKLDLLASRDSLGFLLNEPYKEDPAIRGGFRNETNFFRFIPQWQRKIDSERTARLSAGVGQDILMVDIGDNYFNIKSTVLTVRGEWEQRFSADWMAQFGFDNQYDRSKVNLKIPVFQNPGGVGNPVGGAALREASIDGHSANLGMYWRNDYQFTPQLSLLPSLRLDSFGSTKEKLVSPRLALRYSSEPSLAWKAATGLYYQPPQPQEVSSEYGNPDVKSPHAIHASLGFEKDFREGQSEGYRFSAAYFRRDFSNLVVSSSNSLVRDGVSVPEVYSNAGGGRAHGVETILHMDLAPWSGWISYTLSESKRWDPNHSEYSFQYDQTHNLNVVAAYEYGHNWKFSGRLRYVSGNPYTPVVAGTFDADNDVYIPSRGPYYSERQTPFQQFDFRADKKWILDTEIWSVYFDIQNILNIKNSEQVRYSYDYAQKENVSGLPILPAIGVKGEF